MTKIPTEEIKKHGISATIDARIDASEADIAAGRITRGSAEKLIAELAED